MVEIRTAQPHDPLPDGRCVALIRRFAEDAPRSIIMELLVGHADGTQDTSILLRSDGQELTWEEATDMAASQAEQAGLKLVWRFDRTAGPRETEILEHAGDRTVDMDKLDDTDLEDGEVGPDMRDRGSPQGAPRRF